MSSKSSWLVLALIILAVIFVPLVPNDAPIDCAQALNIEGGSTENCDEAVGYISVYKKFFSH